MFNTPYPLLAPHAATGPSAWLGHPSAILVAATAVNTPTRAPLGTEQLRPGYLVVLIVRKVLRLACEANNNPGPNRVPTDFFTLASGVSSDTGAGRSWAGSRATSRGHHEPRPAADGINRTQSPPKHTSHARRKTCCHGGVGMNCTRGRPAVWLSQIQRSEPAPRRAPTSPPRHRAQPSHHHTPSNHLHQSGQRDSNPRHSAWEADALPTELCPHNGRQSINSTRRIPAQPGPITPDHCTAARHPSRSNVTT